MNYQPCSNRYSGVSDTRASVAEVLILIITTRASAAAELTNLRIFISGDIARITVDGHIRCSG